MCGVMITPLISCHCSDNDSWKCQKCRGDVQESRNDCGRFILIETSSARVHQEQSPCSSCHDAGGVPTLIPRLLQSFLLSSKLSFSRRMSGLASQILHSLGYNALQLPHLWRAFESSHHLSCVLCVPPRPVEGTRGDSRGRQQDMHLLPPGEEVYDDQLVTSLRLQAPNGKY